MNRIFLVRHGGSTGNEDSTFYDYNDSAICLTTNGIRQALATATVLGAAAPRWLKPGDFAMEAFASEYTRAQQTARIALDQMGLLSARPQITELLNERDYGTKYDKRMDTDPNFDGNDSESAHQARFRVRGFIREAESVLYRADVLAFSHMGTIRALVANLKGMSDAEMMTLEVPNGSIFEFKRTFDDVGKPSYTQQPLPANPVVEKTCKPIELPARVQRPANLALTKSRFD